MKILPKFNVGSLVVGPCDGKYVFEVQSVHKCSSGSRVVVSGNSLLKSDCEADKPMAAFSGFNQDELREATPEEIAATEAEINKPKGLRRYDYQQAIDANAACNLGAIIKSLARVVDRIWVEARAIGEGTDWVNRHPIMRMYAEQIMYLSSGGGGDRPSTFHEAYSKCEQMAADTTLPA